jgi:cobalt-zinc-cadmium resistance protein CzcA
MIVRKIIGMALENPIVVILMAVALALFGLYSFHQVNVEAYPDPAPAIVEVVALFPGASAEEVERQVTIPLEVTFAGMPGLKHIRSQSLFGLSDLKMNWQYGSQYTYEFARQEVINRLATISQPLPPNVAPAISPESPTGEIYRYILRVPKDSAGREVYTLNDIKALQDWVLEREFRTVPRIVDVTSFGGTVRRYEVQPDPDRLRRYGLTLSQLQTAITNSNATVGGDYVNQGQVAFTVRSVGLFGGGKDPVNKVLGFEARQMESFLANPDLSDEKKDRLRVGMSRRKIDPPYPELLGVQTLLTIFQRYSGKRVDFPLADEEREHIRFVEQRAALRAAAVLRDEERKRIRDIRSLVIASVNNMPIRVEDVVEGGRGYAGAQPGDRGVIVKHLTRLGRIGYWRADEERPAGSARTLQEVGHDEDDKVQCIVLLRKNEDTLPALKDVKKKVEELNDPASGRMLPGVEIEPYYDRTELLNRTVETVTENLVMGIALVVLILFMFVSNVRTAIIVGINVPLALLFAFSVLFLRGKSANLLSIGAVDFGIIVDSSVIMVENIYRSLASGENADLPIKERILKAVAQIDHALLFSTLIMICAFVPLFTMTGPEGQLFGPMAQTYAFSLAGALVLAITLTPVLAMFMFKNLKPSAENFFVRFLKFRYLRNLKLCLRFPKVTILVFTTLIVGTCFLIPRLGREFMPELEEGNLWIRATAPLNWTLERNVQIAKKARAIMAAYPEVEAIVSQSGRPDDGTDAAGFYNTEYFVPLRPEKDWPKTVEQTGWRSWVWGPKRTRTKPEIVTAMNAELERKIPGVTWNFSQNIRDNVMESLSGIKGDNSVKVFGPDIDRLEELATKVKNALQEIRGIENVGIFHVRGQSHLEFRVDPEKCQKYGVMTADVNNVVASALGGSPQSNMVEGEKLFNISIRWPVSLRNNETSILDIPVDIINNTVVLNQYPGTSAGAVAAPVAKGWANPDPATQGHQGYTGNPITQQAPRIRLRDLVTPVAEDGSPDPNGQFERAGASNIYRENGKRMIAIKFSVRDRDLGSAVNEARQQVAPLMHAPYRTVWSGEFEQMEDAEGRLWIMIPLSLALILILLYAAFRSILDTLVVFSNVFDVGVGGIWALYLTGTHFSTSAAVGFVSLFGVAIMDGLLLISYFNHMRAQGLAVKEAILQGAEKRARPVMMTALTAILGLLPAALSTKIGAQTQRPLAIVVVGGMATTLFLTRYLMPALYTLYGQREPAKGSGGMAH